MSISLFKRVTVVACVLFLPLMAMAENAVRVGDSVTIATDQVVEGDFYAAGDSVVISGETKGDVAIAAGSVTLNSVVDGDALIFAGITHLHASITDDVRVVGGEISIADSVGGDVFVIGGKLTILPTAIIEGDVFFFGGEGEIAGSVAGTISGNAERIRIDATVGGDVEVVTARGLSLGDRAVIFGDVKHTGSVSLNRSAAATVEGEVIEQSVHTEVQAEAQNYLIFIFIVLFTSLTMMLVARNKLYVLVVDAQQNFGVRGLLGAAILFVTPVLSVILFATILGSMLGLVFFFLYMLLFLLALPLSCIMIGVFIVRLFTKKVEINLLTTIVGGITLALLFQIPILGSVIFLLSVLISLGTLVHVSYKAIAS